MCTIGEVGQLNWHFFTHLPVSMKHVAFIILFESRGKKLIKNNKTNEIVRSREEVPDYQTDGPILRLAVLKMCHLDSILELVDLIL